MQSEFNTIRALKDGEIMNFIVLVSKLTEKLSKNGNLYTALSVFDGTTSTDVNMFETRDALYQRGLVKGSILNMQLEKKGQFYNIKDWSFNTDPSISIENFKKKAPIDCNDTFNYLISLLDYVDPDKECTNPQYRSLAFLTKNLLRKYEPQIKKSSAAVTMHHNYLGGLVHHTFRMVQMAMSACEIYTMLNKELLVCGTILHDIGKIYAYNTSDIGDTEMSVQGRLLEHHILGIKIIDEEVRLNPYNYESLAMLEHMIASHHGKPEWGAVVTPAFPEAAMLHLIDMIDSRMNMFEEAYPGQEEGTVSDSKVFGLENSYIYKPFGFDPKLAEIFFYNDAV